MRVGSPVAPIKECTKNGAMEHLRIRVLRVERCKVLVRAGSARK